MASNRVCSFSLKNNIIVFSAIHLASEIALIAVHVLLIVSVVNDWDYNKNVLRDPDPDGFDRRNEGTVSIACYAVIMAVQVTQMVFAVILLIGGVKESTVKCRIWIQAVAGLLFITLIIMVVNTMLGHVTARSALAIAPFVVTFFLKLYIMWVVVAFMKHLRYERQKTRIRKETSF